MGPPAQRVAQGTSTTGSLESPALRVLLASRFWTFIRPLSSMRAVAQVSLSGSDARFRSGIESTVYIFKCTLFSGQVKMLWYPTAMLKRPVAVGEQMCIDALQRRTAAWKVTSTLTLRGSVLSVPISSRMAPSRSRRVGVNLVSFACSFLILLRSTAKALRRVLSSVEKLARVSGVIVVPLDAKASAERIVKWYMVELTFASISFLSSVSFAVKWPILSDLLGKTLSWTKSSPSSTSTGVRAGSSLAVRSSFTSGGSSTTCSGPRGSDTSSTTPTCCRE
mmetsp:Transcript_21275/g.60590  ORF Transcript_21275/g.60590 Transcript_21275/m.60590 type:complete len:279 (-) Transcript_21275:146-982(-)